MRVGSDPGGGHRSCRSGTSVSAWVIARFVSWMAAD